MDQIVQRLAYQIYENNIGEEIALVGVDRGGRTLAEEIDQTLAEISGRKSNCCTIMLDKENPLSKEITLDGAITKLEGMSVVLCDDVLNTGKTLAYCLSKLMALNVKKVETAVLVLRMHGQFPIYANYKGYELATTINEHVQVISGEGVFLS